LVCNNRQADSAAGNKKGIYAKKKPSVEESQMKISDTQL